MSHLLVRVGKAHGRGSTGDEVPNLVIEVGPTPVRILETPRQSDEQFHCDAKKIVEGLAECLPGGTVDQVLRLLLEWKASHLVVRG